MLKIKITSKSYGTKKVLGEIDLTVGQGQVIGIVGDNGAGKTTLFKCIAGLELYNGKILSNLSPLKDFLGFLQTNPIMLSHITGWEYLKLVCTAANIKDDYFEQNNIFELPLNQYAEKYSTGMKKKLALMAVLLQKNELFILDEPFNGVDIQSNMLIVEIIKRLKKQGKMVLISSHIFSTLSEVCDQIHHLQRGKFTSSVEKEGFVALDKKMQSLFVADKLDKFNF